MKELANFVDNKAYIHMYRQGASVNKHHNLRIKIRTTKESEIFLMQKLEKKYGGSISYPNLNHAQYIVCGKAAGELLTDLKPMLKLQEKQATLGIIAGDLCRSLHETKKKVRPNNLRQRDAIYRALSFLNRGDKRISKKTITENNRHDRRIETLITERKEFASASPESVKRYVRKYT